MDFPPRNELDIVVSKSAKSASYGHGSLVCGLWLAGGGRGGSVPTYNLVHYTYVFLVTRATKVGKIVNPVVRPKYLKVNRYGRISATTFF